MALWFFSLLSPVFLHWTSEKLLKAGFSCETKIKFKTHQPLLLTKLSLALSFPLQMEPSCPTPSASRLPPARTRPRRAAPSTGPSPTRSSPRAPSGRSPWGWRSSRSWAANSVSRGPRAAATATTAAVHWSLGPILPETTQRLSHKLQALPGWRRLAVGRRAATWFRATTWTAVCPCSTASARRKATAARSPPVKVATSVTVTHRSWWPNLGSTAPRRGREGKARRWKQEGARNSTAPSWTSMLSAITASRSSPSAASTSLDSWVCTFTVPRISNLHESTLETSTAPSKWTRSIRPEPRSSRVARPSWIWTTRSTLSWRTPSTWSWWCSAGSPRRDGTASAATARWCCPRSSGWRGPTSWRWSWSRGGSSTSSWAWWSSGRTRWTDGWVETGSPRCLEWRCGGWWRGRTRDWWCRCS